MNIRRVTRTSKLVPASSSSLANSSVFNMMDNISTDLNFNRESQFQDAYGQYQFPDGMVYDGGMRNNRFNRSGKLLFKSGARIQGEWIDDSCVNMEYIFADGLKFREVNWKYCTGKDRRYHEEIGTDLPPVGAHSIISKRYGATTLPAGYYHTGEGYYNPDTKCLYSLSEPDVIIRIPTSQEVEWIVKNCSTT